ncbi:MAG TPA: hypothetical protein VM327_05730 [Candidatus Thermoplasmatota archaeon]|nr:hypothetical protein [Candidatus Thermoplasmatota archaeon]
MLDVLKTEDLVVPGHAALEFMSGRGEPIGVLHAIRDSYRLALARDETLVAAARLRASAKGKGRPKWGDLYIAAEAQVQATYVVTANPKDFEALGCAVWDYRRGSAPPS